MSKQQAQNAYSGMDTSYYSLTPLHESVRGPRVSADLPKSQQTTPLSKLACEAKLPQCIRITKTFLASGCHSKFKKGDVFMLHFVYAKPVIHAVDTKTGKGLRLPLYTRQEFEILPLGK